MEIVAGKSLQVRVLPEPLGPVAELVDAVPSRVLKRVPQNAEIEGRPLGRSCRFESYRDH